MGVSRPLLATLVLAAVYWGVAVSGPLAVGAWQDDAIYVTTATSLAEGRGYRHAEIPGEPLQAKYPVLYPALLSVLIWIAPDYPSNVPLLLVPTAIAASALVVLAALYWRRCFAPDPIHWRVACVLSALSPAIVSMVRSSGSPR